MSLLYNCYSIKFSYRFFKTYFKVIYNHAVPIKCCSLKFWIITKYHFITCNHERLIKTFISFNWHIKSYLKRKMYQTIIVRGQLFLNKEIKYIYSAWQCDKNVSYLKKNNLFPVFCNVLITNQFWLVVFLHVK